MKRLLSILLSAILFFGVFTSLAASDELSKDGWTITASSAKDPAERAIDSDTSTIWHSGYKAEGSTITEKDSAPYTLEVTLPDVATVSGFRYYPREGGSSSGIAKSAELYLSADGKKFTKVGEIVYSQDDSNRNARETLFSGNVKIKAFRYVITNAVNGFGTCAELALLKENSSLKTSDIKGMGLSDGEDKAPEKDGAKTDDKTASPAAADEAEKTGWTVTASSSKVPAERAIDSDKSTIWHSGYENEGSTITSKDEAPYTLEVTLPKAESFSGFRYYPRQDGSAAGIVQAAELHLSEDGKTFIKVGEMTYSEELSNRGAREALFSGNVKIKAFRYVITKGQAGFGTCAELALLKENKDLKATDIKSVTLTDGAAKPTEEKKDETQSGSGKGASSSNVVLSENASFEPDEIVPNEKWIVGASSALSGANNAAAAYDGNKATFWHSYYEAKDGNIVYKDALPITYTVTFPEATASSGMRYYPRAEGSSASGIIKRARLYASDDGETFYKITDDFEFLYGVSSSANYKRTPVDITFPKNIRAKAVRMEVTDSVSGFAVASEITVLKPDSKLSTYTAKEFNDKSDELSILAIDKSKVKVTASSEQPYPFENANDLDLTAVKTIDSNIYNTWHTQYRNEDGSTAGFDKTVMPAYLSYDFGTEYEISAVSYIPRGGGFLGTHWVEFSVSTSNDGENFTVADTFTVPLVKYLSFAREMFYLSKPVKARYLKIDITSTIGDDGKIVNKHAGASEVDFYETPNAKKTRETANAERYTLRIGENKIGVLKSGNSYDKTLDSSPFIASGTTLIPLRGLFEEMGATVSWDGENKKITVTASDGKTMVFQAENTRVWIGDVRYGVAVAPRIVNGRTYIPLRFVSEHMGYKVSWDGETSTVTIEA